MNRLQYETSPYLLQHAGNPVDWYPWCDEAFERARKEDKPVLVSIGYAACHWCHVMEHESFEDSEVAAYMNEHFINIKVDREERPDVDHMYMDALQAMTSQGGWPLNMFVTPERKPFYGGTYYPPKRVYQRPSWMEVLEAVRLTWEQNRDAVTAQSEQLIQHLQHINLQETGYGHLPFGRDDFEQIANNMLVQADEQWGGFGMAPKFPQTMSLQFLLHYYYATNNDKALAHVALSINKMLSGGIYDQLGGGLARYSTDAEWLVPHFEKMLYDNALLLTLLADAYAIAPKERYASAMRQTIEFCIRELSINKSGVGFYASLDADSEGEEGKFYVWTYEEVMHLLPDMDEQLKQYWDIRPEGNWEGKIILNTSHIDEDWLQAAEQSDKQFYQKLNHARDVLMAARARRPRPQTDNKVLLSWNALMTVALLQCGRVLNEESYLRLGAANLRFLLDTYRMQGEWYRNFSQGKLSVPATLEDYAYLIKALFAGAEVLRKYEYALIAKDMMAFVHQHFSDADARFYYFTHAAQSEILVRKVETYDGALPSVNAVMAHNNLLLSLWFEDQHALARCQGMLQSINSVAHRYPSSFGHWCYVLLNMVTQKTLVVKGAELEFSGYWPQILITYAVENKEIGIPLIDNVLQVAENHYQYCSQNTCYPPIKEKEKLFLKIKLDKMLE